MFLCTCYSKFGEKTNSLKMCSELDMVHKYYLPGSITADILSHQRIYYLVRLHVPAAKGDIC